MWWGVDINCLRWSFIKYMSVDFLEFLFLGIYKRTSLLVFFFSHFHVSYLLSTDFPQSSTSDCVFSSSEFFVSTASIFLSFFCFFFCTYADILKICHPDSPQAPKTQLIIFSAQICLSLTLIYTPDLCLRNLQPPSHPSMKSESFWPWSSLLTHSSKSSQFNSLKISRLLPLPAISLRLLLSLSPELL